MWRPGWDCSGNPNQRRFRPFGDVPLFEKMLRINMLGDILAVESGYEEGCRWGANKTPPSSSSLGEAGQAYWMAWIAASYPRPSRANAGEPLASSPGGLVPRGWLPCPQEPCPAESLGPAIAGRLYRLSLCMTRLAPNASCAPGTLPCSRSRRFFELPLGIGLHGASSPLG